MGRLFGVALFGLAGVSAALLVAACGTDAQGVETCRRIEAIRCQEAPRCQVRLDTPIHTGDPVEACIRYYHTACLHGLVAQDPGGPATEACVQALTNADCNVVLHPETAPACQFLVPPTPTPPPMEDAAADAGTDAGVPLPMIPMLPFDSGTILTPVP